MSNYNKFIVAIVGAAIGVAINVLGANNVWLNDIVSILTALGVYGVANK